MTLQDFEAFVYQNINPSFQRLVLLTARPAIRLKTEPKIDTEIGIGESKIGGYPDLPPHYDWPLATYTSEFLWFTAQIKIEEFKKWDVENVLPEKGILYFFNLYDCGQVLFYDGNYTQLERRTPPVELQPKRRNWLQRIFTRNERKIFEGCKLNASFEYTIHHWEALYQSTLDSSENVFNGETFFANYDKLIHSNESDSRHLLLGYGTPIQCDYIEAYPVKGEKWSYPTETDIEEFNKWTLLLQLDSDFNTKMCWGDWGRIYFLIEKEKLKKADFSNVYVTSECY